MKYEHNMLAGCFFFFFYIKSSDLTFKDKRVLKIKWLHSIFPMIFQMNRNEDKKSGEKKHETKLNCRITSMEHEIMASEEKQNQQHSKPT